MKTKAKVKEQKTYTVVLFVDVKADSLRDAESLVLADCYGNEFDVEVADYQLDNYENRVYYAHPVTSDVETGINEG
jgi:hypothetical protein